MTELAKSLSKLICLVSVKTGEDGKMFGTVTAGMIADQLKTQFDVTLDKRKIHLDSRSALWVTTTSSCGCIRMWLGR
jgi:large subunit ribosomal protein L9